MYGKEEARCFIQGIRVSAFYNLLTFKTQNIQIRVYGCNLCRFLHFQKLALFDPTKPVIFLGSSLFTGTDFL
jgi:hypothetical protein